MTSAGASRNTPIWVAPVAGSKGLGQLKGLAMAFSAPGRNTAVPALDSEEKPLTPALETGSTVA